MRIDLKDYPPDGGKSLVLRKKLIYKIFDVIISLILCLLSIVTFYSGLHPQKLHLILIGLIGVVLFLFLAGIMISSCLRSMAESFTINEQGVMHYNKLNKLHFIGWPDIQSIDLEYVYAPRGGKVTLIAVRKTNESKSYRFPVRGLGVNKDQFLEFLRRWHQYYNQQIAY